MTPFLCETQFNFLIQSLTGLPVYRWGHADPTVSALQKEPEVQYYSSVLLLTSLMESSFALLITEVKQESNAWDNKKYRIKHPRTELCGAKGAMGS